MLRDAHYRAKLAHRARGLHDLERHVGDVCGEIDARLARGRPVVRVLELGCGYGTALLELRARYGHRVELHGFNRVPDDGNTEIMLRNAVDHRIFGDATPAAADIPVLAYGDVAAGLPFDDGAFDLVVSPVPWLYFGRKIDVIREVIRVLRGDGLARIDADESRPGMPAEYARLVEIWDDDTVLPFGEYLARHGLSLAPAPDGHFLRIAKVAGFGSDVDPVLEIDLSALHAHWDGIKCVYRVRTAPGSARPAAADRGT